MNLKQSAGRPERPIDAASPLAEFAVALRGLRAAQDAVLAAEEAERRAASAVHDVVLSVLRAVVMDDPPLPSVLATKAQLAQDALARGWSSFADLGSALRRQALGFAPELNVACRIDGDLDVPAAVAEALSGAVGEALRNVAMHAGVRDVTVTAHSNGPGGVEVTVHDDGAGFDPARVGPASTGLRNSVRRRMRDTSGTAAVISSPGEGTTVILTWQPPEQAAAEPVDLLAWARRVAPRPGLVFLGFMLPILLSSLVLLCLRWDDQRWQPVPVAVFLGMLGLAALCARYLSEVRMTGRAALGLVAANTVLATVGTLAVAPGATDAFAWWVAGVSGIVIAAVYFIRGPAFGLSALVFDAAALTAGLVVTGGGIAASGWVSVLTSPAIDAGLAVGFLAAFRGLSRYAESQLPSTASALPILTARSTCPTRATRSSSARPSRSAASAADRRRGLRPAGGPADAGRGARPGEPVGAGPADRQARGRGGRGRLGKLPGRGAGRHSRQRNRGVRRADLRGSFGTAAASPAVLRAWP